MTFADAKHPNAPVLPVALNVSLTQGSRPVSPDPRTRLKLHTADKFANKSDNGGFSVSQVVAMLCS